MVEDHRERRVKDSSALLERIEDLAKVRKDSRVVHVQNLLSDAVEQSCKQHGGKGAFTDRQVEAIKDVAFKMFYILDPTLKSPRGFFKSCYRAYVELPPLQKVAYGAGAAAFIGSAIIGGISLTETAYEYLGPKKQTQQQQQPAQSTPARPTAQPSGPQSPGGPTFSPGTVIVPPRP